MLLVSQCSLISNQSGLSPLTSGINKAFSPTERPLIVYFSYLNPSLYTFTDGCEWKSPKSQEISNFYNTQSSPSGTNNQAVCKVFLWAWMMLCLEKAWPVLPVYFLGVDLMQCFLGCISFQLCPEAVYWVSAATISLVIQLKRKDLAYNRKV